MQTTSKNTSLLILVVTALVLSRAMFSFFNDPEGPNLLIVTVMAAILYFPSLATYKYSRVTGFKKLLLSICVQVALVAIFYFCLR